MADQFIVRKDLEIIDEAEGSDEVDADDERGPCAVAAGDGILKETIA